MSERAKLIVDRMEQRLAAVCKAVPPIRPGAAYWLDSDAGLSYCSRCVNIARGDEFELGAPLRDGPTYSRDEWEDAFYDGIDGGFDTTSDSTATCEICHRTLSYILSDYGVEDEIEFYREAPLIAVRDEDTYALDRLALNIWPGSPRLQILGVAVAVNQAYRLLFRPRCVAPPEVRRPKGLDAGSHLVRNSYDCPCGESWDDVWDCGCDDECGGCGLTISPTESDDDPECDCAICMLIEQGVQEMTTFRAIDDRDAQNKAFSGLYDGMGGGFGGLRALVCIDEDAGEYVIREAAIDPDEILPEEGDLTEACRDRFPLSDGERLVGIQ